MSFVILAAALALSGAPAQADVCRGPAPQAGEVVTGVVLHVVDGQRLCLADGPTPDRWTEVVLDSAQIGKVSDGGAAWAKTAVMSAAFGKKLTCRVEGISAGRPVARCIVGGVSLAQALSAPGAAKQVAEWYAPTSRSPAATLIASR